ncbi:MAG: PIN domain-containing protein [Halothiobacillaceae bacterium]|nr:PIN domain-containing protein [Halothiobacillaceae bacterium]
MPRPKNTTATAIWGGLPAGSTVFVDTAPFIYVLESHPQFADLFAGLFEAAENGSFSIVLSTITLAEVLTGPHKAGLTALAKRYEIALCQYEVIPVSVSIAALAAQLRVQHRLKLPDALQLATALETGANAFVTHDRDFSGVTALPVLTGG